MRFEQGRRQIGRGCGGPVGPVAGDPRAAVAWSASVREVRRNAPLVAVIRERLQEELARQMVGYVEEWEYRMGQVSELCRGRRVPELMAVARAFDVPPALVGWRAPDAVGGPLVFLEPGRRAAVLLAGPVPSFVVEERRSFEPVGILGLGV